MFCWDTQKTCELDFLRQESCSVQWAKDDTHLLMSSRHSFHVCWYNMVLQKYDARSFNEKSFAFIKTTLNWLVTLLLFYYDCWIFSFGKSLGMYYVERGVLDKIGTCDTF